jgi:MFS family permease
MSGFGSFANLLAIPLFGALSDRRGRRSIYIAGAGLAIVWAFAFFQLLDTKLPARTGLAVIIGLIIHASMWGPQSSFITEQLPALLRYTGSSCPTPSPASLPAQRPRCWSRSCANIRAAGGRPRMWRFSLS